MIARAPETLVRRDREAQLGPGHLVDGGALRAGAPLRQVVRHPDLGVEAGAVEVVPEAQLGAFTLSTKPRTSPAGSEYASPSADSTAVMNSSAHSGSW